MIYICHDCRKKINAPNAENLDWQILYIGYGAHVWVCKDCNLKREAKNYSADAELG